MSREIPEHDRRTLAYNQINEVLALVRLGRPADDLADEIREAAVALDDAHLTELLTSVLSWPEREALGLH